MKKITFLLLFFYSIISIGQVSSGMEQEFDYGIKNNSLQTITTPTYIGTFGTDGTQGKIPSAYIAKTAAVQDSLNKKLNLPTGFLQGLALSINADPTKFNIAAGYYVVTDFTNLTQPVVKIINYAGVTGLTPAYLATANSTYVALDVNGTVISSASPFTDAQRRSLAIIGNVVHSNRTTINIVNEIKAPIVAVGNQLHDFMKAIGFLNESGNVYSANGANLQINKSVGDIFGMGINASDYLSPHKLTIPSQTALTFAYRFQNGTQLADTQNINPNIYDVGGTSTTTPSNKWTIQRINLFQSGLSRIQPGQTVYNSFNDAVVALPTQPFVTEQNIADNAVFRCYLIVQQGTTNLASAVAGGTAQFVPVDKFGNIIGNGSVALTYSNIVAALGFAPENIANKSDSYTASSSTTYASTKALVDGLGTKQNTLTNPITGTGTLNKLAKFTGTGTVGDSQVFDNGTNVGIGTNTPTVKFNIYQENNSAGYTKFIRQELKGTISTFVNYFEFQLGSTDARGGRIVFGELNGTFPESGIDFNLNKSIFYQGGNYPLVLKTNNIERVTVGGNGNVLIGTTTDNGVNKLQVNGTISATSLTLSTAPTTSAGTYDILTRNTSTGVVENVLSSSVVGGSGTTNYIPKFTASGTVGNSSIQDSGSLVTIGNSLVTSTNITSSTNNVVLSDNQGVVFRGVRANAWTDNLSSRFFQIGNVSDRVIFTTQSGNVANRMLFTSAKTQIINGLFSDAPAPVGIFEVLNTSTNVAFGISTGGRTLISTTTDNGVDALQVNGSISATGGTTANQVVVKSQLDGKVSLTGNETIAGVKSFSSGNIKLYDTTYGGYNTMNTSVDAFNFKNTSNSNIFSVGNGLMSIYNSTGLFNCMFSTIPLTADRTLTLPNASGTIALVETVKPYKVYTALLSQTGTSSPTATVLENTLGGSITWTYTSTGSYVGTLTSAFTLNKTWTIATGSGSADTTITVSRSSDNTVNVSTLLAGTPTNGIISPASIEIRVYN